MSVRRLSVSVPEHVERAIRESAANNGVSVSTWLTRVAERAAENQAALADGLAAIDEFEEEYGPLDPADLERARQELVAAGVIPARRAAG